MLLFLVGQFGFGVMGRGVVELDMVFTRELLSQKKGIIAYDFLFSNVQNCCP